MTLSEFKAWFEGFTENMDSAPNEKQWKRIKAKVGEITGSSITKTVFVDRYYEPYRRYWANTSFELEPLKAYYSAGTIDHGDGLKSQSTPGKADLFNASAAMADAGRAEYKAMLS